MKLTYTRMIDKWKKSTNAPINSNKDTNSNLKILYWIKWKGKHLVISDKNDHHLAVASNNSEDLKQQCNN